MGRQGIITSTKVEVIWSVMGRPSPWGRATAERQDVVSHLYRKAEEIFCTFIQPADVGSHHLEY